MRGRFLLTAPIPEPGLAMLSEAGKVTTFPSPPSAEVLAEACESGEFDVAITQLTDRFETDVLASAHLDGIANYAVGTDNIDVAAATANGILVANTPGVMTEATADIALLLMLATARRCIAGDTLVRTGGFNGWSPDLLLGQDVTGARLGIVGGGRIAVATARRAAGFAMHVRHCSARGPHDQVPCSQSNDPVLGPLVSFDELVETSDIVSLHVPLTSQTHHLVDADVFRRMKSTAILVNTARGAIVDELALVAALKTGEIAGAGLDVYQYEPTLAPGLTDLDNTVLLPHLGSSTVRVRSRMAELTAANAIAMSQRRLPPHPVNPEAWSGR